MDAKIKHKGLVYKFYIDKKLININKKITSKKPKHKQADKKLTDQKNFSSFIVTLF